MNRERLMTVLESYGSHERAWPADERTALKMLLDEDPDARAALQQARELDSLLDEFQPPLPDLTETIMRSIPMGRLERLGAWLMPGGVASVFRPALLGALPFFFGLVLGLSTPSDSELLGNGSWEAQERLLLMSPQGESWYE